MGAGPTYGPLCPVPLCTSKFFPPWDALPRPGKGWRQLDWGVSLARGLCLHLGPRLPSSLALPYPWRCPGNGSLRAPSAGRRKRHRLSVRSESGRACEALVPEESKVTATATTGPRLLFHAYRAPWRVGARSADRRLRVKSSPSPGRDQASLPVQTGAGGTAAWWRQRNLAEKLRTRSSRLTSALGPVPACARASQHQPAC